MFTYRASSCHRDDSSSPMGRRGLGSASALRPGLEGSRWALCAGAGVACASHPVPAASGHTHASPGQTWVKGQEARKEQDSGPQPLSLPVPADPRADLREPSRPGFTSSAFSGHQASLTPVPTQGELRISVLPAYLSYDAPWPVRKIPLRCTAHYVAYHVESKVRPHSAGDPWGWTTWSPGSAPTRPGTLGAGVGSGS